MSHTIDRRQEHTSIPLEQWNYLYPHAENGLYPCAECIMTETMTKQYNLDNRHFPRTALRAKVLSRARIVCFS